tara:strand:+ start:5026 stop:5391 length:366 start_codon:yes stop_codon:yes gene_type:complete
MSETSKNLPEIKLELGSKSHIRVFRNQVGLAFVGKPPNLTPVRTGLVPGSADLIGWTSKIIRQEDVGSKVAVFTSVEVKTTTGRMSDKQDNWKEQVEMAGGIAIKAVTGKEALTKIENWRL